MVPSLSDLLDSLVVVSIPLAVRFRGIDVREAALFEGPSGWTEFSPFLEYDDAESAAWLAGAIEFGWDSEPPAVRDRVRVNATVPAVDASTVPAILARFPGCRTAKVKVAERGQTLADDIARVRAAREILGDEGRVRIDANGGWNVDEAEHAVLSLQEFDLEYVEQPCATLEELAELRGRLAWTGVLVAADESIRKADDPLAVARAGAADVIIVKAQPLGGISRALDIVTAAGLPAVVSSALDTAVGISMGVRLAASLPELDFDCGLGTGALLTADVADVALEDGAITVERASVSNARIAELRAPAERDRWWRERVTRVHALLNA